MHPDHRQGLFLLTGARRTGTTLLNSVVCSDPAANPLVAEVQILTRWVEAYQWGKANFELQMESYFSAPEEFRRFSSRQLEAFVDHCWRRFAPASHLVLKNPELSLVIEEVAELLPRARFLISVRDPRDQVVSELETGLRQILRGMDNPAVAERDFEALAANYARYYEPIIRTLRAAADRFLVVRYEDLLLRTTESLRALSEFTGLALRDYDPGAPWTRVALDLESRRDEFPSMTKLYGQPMDPTRVGRYRDSLSPAEIATVERVCRMHLEAFGYAPFEADNWRERLLLGATRGDQDGQDAEEADHAPE